MTKTDRVLRLLELFQSRLATHDSGCARELDEALRALATTEPRQPASTVPGCTHLPEALVGADPSLRDAMETVAGDLAWRVPGFGHLPRSLTGRMAASELVGPGGMIGHDRVSLGVILLAPKLDYPSHSHAAEELYLVLSGTLDWEIDDGRTGPVRAGEFVHHKPWQRHAMATGAEPALLFWGWTGNIRGDTYSMDNRTTQTGAGRHDRA